MKCFIDKIFIRILNIFSIIGIQKTLAHRQRAHGFFYF